MTDGGAPDPSESGALKIGRYVVLERLGARGEGVLHVAYDPVLDRKVALKLLPKEAARSEDAEARLLLEGQTLARLSHPNVVNVHDVGEADGSVFVAMELVTGTPLPAWLEGGSRGWREIVSVFVQAGRGLSAAHALGIVHGHFDAGAVVVGGDGRARVSDFGVGEDAGRKDKDARSDQQAFCLALADALQAKGAGAGRLPSWLTTVLARGLRPDPEARFPSMDALLAALARDRRAAWMRVFAVAALLLAVGLLVFGWARAQQKRRLACMDGGARLAGAWDDDRRDAAGRAFTATGKPFAAMAWQSARAALDAYAGEWSRAYEDACAATHVRGEQSAEALDLRMACLEDRRAELAAVADVFGRADVAVVTNAFAASQSLPKVAACNDVAALRARVKPPSARDAAEVEALGRDLAGLRAMVTAGKQRDVVGRARELVEVADRLGYAPLQVEALFLDGAVRDKTGDYAGAEAALFRAARLADAAGDDRKRVDVETRLIDVACLREAKYDLLPLLESETEAAMARAGGYEEGQARLALSIGGVLVGEGKPEEALEMDQRALALWEKIRGPEGREVARALGNMGVAYGALSDTDRALDSDLRALSIETKLLGPDHPDLVTELHNIANMYQAKLEFAEAAKRYEEAAKIAEASLGPDNPMLAECLDGEAECIVELGEADRAVALQERALAIQEKTLDPNNPQLVYALLGLGDALLRKTPPDAKRAVSLLERALALPSTGYDDDAASVKFALARALVASGGDAARAKRLALEARDTMQKNAELPAEKQNLSDVEAWLAARR